MGFPVSQVAAGSLVGYTYDSLGRLATVTNSNGVTTTYTYDAAGNRTLQVVADTVPIAGAVAVAVPLNSANNPVPLKLSGVTAASVTTTNPNNGSIARPSATTVTYTPAAGFIGADSFSYTASTGGSPAVSSTPAPIVVTVFGPPAVGAVSQSVGENKANNDISLAITTKAPLTGVAVFSQATHGTATATGTSIAYTPAANYFGPDSFAYTASNVAGTSAPATVTLNVIPPPIAGPITVSTYEGIGKLIHFALSGGPADSVVVGTPLHGVASPNLTDVWYQPAQGYYGPDNFTYTAHNIGGDSTGTISVNVVSLNPEARNVWATVSINAVTFGIQPDVSPAGYISDIVHDPVSQRGGQVTHSGIYLSYTPPTDYTGPDSFSYYVTSNLVPQPYQQSNTAVVYITVTTAITQPTSLAVNANAPATPVPVRLGGNIDHISVSSGPSHGTATVNGLSISYTPAPNYVGADSFQYTATGPDGAVSPPSVASIAVGAPLQTLPGVIATAPNNYYSASGTLFGSCTTGPDQSFAPNNALVQDGAAFVACGANTNGVELLKYDFGIANWVSAVELDGSYWSDGVGAATLGVYGSNDNATWTLLKTYNYSGQSWAQYGPDNVPGGLYRYVSIWTQNVAANQWGYLWVDRFKVVGYSLPTTGPSSSTVAQNSTNNPIALNITGATPSSLHLATDGLHGHATVSGTSITYTPTTGYVGSDSFTYTATNSVGTGAPTTVSITVAAPPIAGAASASVMQNSSANLIALSLTGNPATSVAVSSPPSHGSVTVSGTSIRYSPASGYFGPDSFSYTATGAVGPSQPAAVAITVVPLPPTVGAVSAPVATNSTANPVALAISGNPATSVAVSSAASHGTAVASGTSITYTPAAGFTGVDSFSYTATNAGGTSSPATVTVSVGVNIGIWGAFTWGSGAVW